MTVTANPATAGNLCSAAMSNAAMVTNFYVSGGVCSRPPRGQVGGCDPSSLRRLSTW